MNKSIKPILKKMKVLKRDRAVIIWSVLLWLQTRAAYKKVMEENGVSDPNSMDKNYWIQRVGEVSS
jgi:hypothetical protein